MSTAMPHPPLARRSMLAEPWAGSPLTRPLRRLLGRAPRPPERNPDDVRPLMPRRVLLLVLVVFCAFLGTQAMADVLPHLGATLAERALLVLFGVLFAWISAGFWTAVMGAGVLVFGRERSPLMRRLAAQPVRPLDPTVRTAIIMPICNEHVPTVFGGLSATIDSLVSTGESEHFDVYVLSDTSDPDIRAAEHAAWSELASRMVAEAEGDESALRVHYRWRQRRT
jgi:membrane glycosyltransferase